MHSQLNDPWKCPVFTLGLVGAIARPEHIAFHAGVQQPVPSD